MATSEGATRISLCDFISRLPDELILKILDKLPLVDAIRTGELSHRWKNAWKCISVIEFGPSWVQSTGKDIVSSVDKFISLHQGWKIKRFHVKLTYKPEISEHIDLWILFAVSKHVEDLDLNFAAADANIVRNTPMPSYVLPPYVFTCRSLVNLSLSCCDLILPPICQLVSLQDVHLYLIELPPDAIYRLTVNSPLLESLILTECNRTRDLHVNIPPTPNFQVLTILDSFEVNRQTRMEINAPSCPGVILLGFMQRLEYNIVDLSECFQARLWLQQMFLACQRMEHVQNILETDMGILGYENMLYNFLDGLEEVGYLSLCRWTIQILARRELRRSERLCFDCVRVELDTRFWKWELPGIIYMLKACHVLDHLVINIKQIYNNEHVTVSQAFKDQYDFNVDGYFNSQVRFLRGKLSCLRIVEFHNAEGGSQAWDDNGNFNISTFFDGCEPPLELIRLLRTTAVNLKSIVFTKGEKLHKIQFGRRRRRRRRN